LQLARRFGATRRKRRGERRVKLAVDSIEAFDQFGIHKLTGARIAYFVLRKNGLRMTHHEL
jgi:hypothetical protein